MSLFSRDQCLQRLRAQVAAGRRIIGGGAGTGLSAKRAGAGGTDPIIIYHSGRFPTPGRGSLTRPLHYAYVNPIAAAHELGLLTCPYVFTEDEAKAMARAGADVLIPHMGLTTKGTIGARTALTLSQAAERVQALHDAAKLIHPDILVLCHGGPIAE